MLRTAFARLLGMFGRRRAGVELDEEIQTHIGLMIEDLRHRGLDPAEARRQALVAFGGVEQTREAWRDRRGLP
ncbi:MAG: permease prefix domain 1-containing protein, partial [Bryobacteraceae bacterium]